MNDIDKIIEKLDEMQEAAEVRAKQIDITLANLEVKVSSIVGQLAKENEELRKELMWHKLQEKPKDNKEEAKKKE